MSNYIIFGGTGSFGTAMTRLLLSKGDEVTVFSRTEKLQFEHKQRFHSEHVHYLIGDIRDRERVEYALSCSEYDAVILASAMKHIDKCEQYPLECKKTNIDGCVNVIDAAIEHKIPKICFLSTDKACNSQTLYGTTKLFIEEYGQATCTGTQTEFIRTRYGNIVGSAGSVCWVWDNCVKQGIPLTVTNPNITRFFMTIVQAVNLVYRAITEGVHKDLWVYKNKSCTIQELADCFSDNQIVTGLRCVEKTDEALLTVGELNHSELVDGKYYHINENITSATKYTEPLTSDNAERLTKAEILDMLAVWNADRNL